MRRLLFLPHPPTAIFARNDAVAIGAIQAARDLGRRIPDDIAIAPFDSLPMSAYTTPSIDTVNQPTALLGLRAAEYVLDRIEGKYTSDRRDLCLDCEVVIRESTLGRAAHLAG